MRTTLRLLTALVCLLWMAPPVLAQGRPTRLVTFDYPPFMVADSAGQLSGLMIDVVTEAFKRMGKAVRIELYPFSRCLAMVEAGDADAMFTIKRTPQREARYLFPKEPVLTQHYVFFVRSNSALEFKGTLTDFANTTIGVVDNTSYGGTFDAAVKQGVFKKLDTAPNYESNFRKLLVGRVDAVIISQVVGQAIVKRLNAAEQVRVSGPAVETAMSYMMFNKKTQPALISEFDKAIASMREDGTLGRIQNAYSQ
ncbi:substrate-binding periplasmic protein [Niveibacterium microcysteis]|uniref:Amino acid ABC transporter substrate-binding protein n=1 Tax=Niveibacterium microcysteis TaxID=2811415 RepID=A0ABX7MBI3_9RHOO|nr:transporter substrate-binding domain-containing protein [Niveibacterium microcysteis]QSI78513.1 amino acid ABC transporter substrate-binding protein [Niveibacterium microcysteis]